MALFGQQYCYHLAILFCLVAVSLSPLTGASSAVLVRVDQSGKGDYTKIQDAIDSVPSSNSEVVFIWIKPGTYREQVVVPADKPFITLSGTKRSLTIITCNKTGELYESPTLTVFASDFVARYLTIENTFGASQKAVAVRVVADRAAFYGCVIRSSQDSLLAEIGRHYYKNCYIQGATDFICGNAAALFERCNIHTLAEGTGSITAQRRESEAEETGFIFLGCKITGNGTAMLGRPWGDYSRVVFAMTFMSNAILPPGWDDWGDSSHHSTVYYGQYKCYGPGANTSKRVEWSRKFTSKDVEPFLTRNFIGGRSWMRPVPTSFTRAYKIHA